MAGMTHDFSHVKPGDKLGVEIICYGHTSYGLVKVASVTTGRRGVVKITTSENRVHFQDGRENVKGSSYHQLVPLTDEHLRRVQEDMNASLIRKVNWGLLSNETVAQVLDVLRAAGVPLPPKVIG